MRVLTVCSELSPLARTGGLGDAVAALATELDRRGHASSAVIPGFRGVREHRALDAASTGVRISVPVGPKGVEAEIFEGRLPSGLQVFLVGSDAYFDREGLYGAGGDAYGDNAERFLFFAKVAVELARRMDPPPELLHAHDWQAAMVPVFTRAWGLPFKTVLTIHNIAYQGAFGASDFALTNLPGEFFSPAWVEFYGGLNFLKGGILAADAITTVSERYAREIQTPEYGAGLDRVMVEHSGRLRGILNGVDYSVWDPVVDRLIAKAYSPGKLAGKAVCRAALLEELGLAPEPRGPVFNMVTRLAEQKGIALLLPLLDRLLADDVRLVVLGEGEGELERHLAVASRKHARRFAFRRGVDEALSHRILAGADVTLQPSHFEPCGLGVMYSLKYGTVPVARACGGLHQILRDHDPAGEPGNGILFYPYHPEAFWDALRRAKKLFANPVAWRALMRRGMECSFSWREAAGEYEKVYAEVLGARG